MMYSKNKNKSNNNITKNNIINNNNSSNSSSNSNNSSSSNTNINNNNNNNNKNSEKSKGTTKVDSSSLLSFINNATNVMRNTLDKTKQTSNQAGARKRDPNHRKHLINNMKESSLEYTAYNKRRYKRRSISSNSQTGESLTDSSEYLTDTMRALFVESTESESGPSPGITPVCSTPCVDSCNEDAIFFADSMWIVQNQITNSEYGNNALSQLHSMSSPRVIAEDLIQTRAPCTNNSNMDSNMYHHREAGYEASMEDIISFNILNDVHVDTSVNYPLEVNLNYAFDDSIPNSTGVGSSYHRSINSAGYHVAHCNAGNANNTNSNVYDVSHEFSLTHPPLSYRSSTDSMVTGMPTHPRYTNNDLRSAKYWRNRKSVVHDVSPEFSSVDNQVMQDVLSQSDIQTAINELADIARPKRLRTQSNSAVNDWDGSLFQGIDAECNDCTPWSKYDLTSSYDVSYTRHGDYSKNRNHPLEQPVCERPKSWSIGRQVNPSKTASKRKSCPVSTNHFNDTTAQAWNVAGLDRFQNNDCLWEWIDSPSENSLQRSMHATQNDTSL